MKKTILVLIVTMLLSSCQEKECTQKIHSSVLLVDLTDTTIVQLLHKEIEMVVSKLSPAKLDRCEGVKIDVIPIGATIENQGVKIEYPVAGVLDANLGAFGLEDSNKAKTIFLVHRIGDALDSFKDVGDSKSQIFFAINYLLRHKKGRCIIYSDLLENYDRRVSFFRTGYNFEETLKRLIELYAIDSISQPSFGGKLTIVTPMTKHQDQIMYARAFYKYYFDKIGLSPLQYEIVGTLSESKF